MGSWTRSLDGTQLVDVDRLTRWAASSITRRVVLKGAIGSVAAMVLARGSWLEPLVAEADFCHNNCNSPCSNCYTETPCCCSPNNQVCYCGASCSCNPCNGSCGCFYAWQLICDSGAHSYGCNPLCWC